MKILTVEQMRRVEQDCAEAGLPTNVLMENAGKAIAEEIRRILGDIDTQRILMLIGPGNNGGDGLVAARYLHDWGAKVGLYLCGQRPAEDSNFQLISQRSLDCIEAIQDEHLGRLDDLLLSATVIIDALFGIGKSRPLDDSFARVLDRVRQAKGSRSGLQVIALDVPSGLNADSGVADPACLYADNTVTLGFPKPGLFNHHGVERAGRVTVVDIGIPSYLAEQITTELITADWVRSLLPRRPLWANKGSFGKVLVVAGSINYIGAAYLACSGAIRVGAGLVTLATPSSLQPVLAAKLTEVTYLPLPESKPGVISSSAAKLIHREFNHYDVLLVGCGLGQSQSSVRLIKSILSRLESVSLPMIFDADALNSLTSIPHWWQQLASDVILTPHHGEMARLAGVSIDEVQSDRMGIAKRIALEWHKTIVLKGAHTVIVAPGGASRISPMANPGLASAGTGDVLSGVIAGLVAQGLNLFEAAACGVYLHGEAGEMIRNRLGDAGMIATDLLPALPLAIKQLKEI